MNWGSSGLLWIVTQVYSGAVTWFSNQPKKENSLQVLDQKRNETLQWSIQRTLLTATSSLAPVGFSWYEGLAGQDGQLHFSVQTTPMSTWEMFGAVWHWWKEKKKLKWIQVTAPFSFKRCKIVKTSTLNQCCINERVVESEWSCFEVFHLTAPCEALAVNQVEVVGFLSHWRYFCIVPHLCPGKATAASIS